MCVMICAKVAIFLIFAGKMSKITCDAGVVSLFSCHCDIKNAVSLMFSTRRGAPLEGCVNAGEGENEGRDFAVS